MTETQAKSGKAEPAATPAKAESEASEASNPAAGDATRSGPAAAGRTPGSAETAATSSDSARAGKGGAGKSGKPTATGAASVPKFTRAPGMAPPPDKILPSQSDKPDSATPADSTVVAPGAAVARATVRGAAQVGQPSNMATQPITTGARPGAPHGGGPAPPPRSAPAGAASRVTEAIRNARATVTAAASRGPRRAR